MPDIPVERIKRIKSFPSLVKFLRDDLDWPLGSDEIDELVFEYEPDELGIAPEIAVKIREIKQLRPLAANQPWGIFYIGFEPKRLPVVVLRRILQKLVVKKRQSAEDAHRNAWKLHDLLFISSYGEEDQRAITLAHFSEDDESKLPTLRVIGWDSQDTPLHIDRCISELETLRFDEELTPDQWRENWSRAFTLEHREVINKSKVLAKKLAKLATRIRNRVNVVLAVESEKGPMRQLYKAFQETLIHDLSEDDFADMYAQTITYGLFSTKKSRPAGLVADNLIEMVPRTNPFLRELLSAFLTVGGRKGKIDFDELGIDDVVQTLRNTDMDAVLRDFGDSKPEEDPVIHFYEDFLKEYDPKKKVKRGVFYTPKPIVSFIVRSVHEIMQKEFGLEYGLADTTTWEEMIRRHKEIKLPEGVSKNDPFVQILDPAAGTGTFLVEVIGIIHRTMQEKWEKEGHLPLEFEKLWNEYVPRYLLPRLYGFELMMAPYAIAHMKIGLKLYETSYRFNSDERVRVYLTNSLEPPHDFSDRFEFDAPALAHEARAVNAVKSNKHFTTIIGNPPYSKSSQNQGQWIDGIMEQYKRTVRKEETQIQALSDDYSKFFRFGHFTLEQSQAGILSFITNNSYLDGPLFRDMRCSMLGFFEGIQIVNLHGDSRKQFLPPEGKADENIFDIQQGVATCLFWRKRSPQCRAIIRYEEIWGTREERYETLQRISDIQSTSKELQPVPPFFLFIPVEKDLEVEFHAGWHLYDVFGTGDRKIDNHESYGAGFVTQQDKFAIGFLAENLVDNVREFLDPKVLNEWLWEKFEFCSTNQWNFERAIKKLKGLDIPKLIKRCLYRPFDYRFTIFDRNICTIIRKRITFQFDYKNIGLLTTRRITRLPFNNVFVTNHYTEYKVASHDRNTIVFPLWIQADEDKDTRRLIREKKQLNFNPGFLQKIAQLLSLPQEQQSGLPQGMAPEDIFFYVYAVLYSPEYRKRYAEFLKIDFSRVMLTSSLELFRALTKLGGELVSLHLMESDKLNKYITDFPVNGDNSVTKVGEKGKTLADVKNGKGKLFINKTQYFDSLPEEVWLFHIGGYQVCHKWLAARKKAGRKLSTEDIEHYNKIVVAINETIKIMKQIDEVIEAHGGWPIK